MKINFENVLIGKKYTCSLAIHASIHLLVFFNFTRYPFLNNRLLHLNLSNTKLCCLCKLDNETPEHPFSRCGVTSGLWTTLQNRLTDVITLGPLTPQSAALGFLDLDPKISNFLINYFSFLNVLFTNIAKLHRQPIFCLKK